MRFHAAAACALLAATVAPAAGQDLRARIAAAPDGHVAFRFAARPGVCGDGDVIVRQRPGAGTSISYVGSLSSREGRDFEHLDTWCRPGPVHVELRREGGRVNDLRITVAGEVPDAFDLGEVAPDGAVAYLVEELAPTAPRRVAGRALHAASLAAAEAWRPMLDLARDTAVHEKVRDRAVHWLAVDASDRLLEGVAPLDDAMELRRQAVFALSRRKDERSRQALRELARAGTPDAIRAAAVYWLGISGEPDALPLLESVLRGA